MRRNATQERRESVLASLRPHRFAFRLISRIVMLRVLIFPLVLLLCVITAARTQAQDVATPEPPPADAETFVKRWLPRTHAKLIRRQQDIHAVVLGDSINLFFQQDPKLSLKIQRAWHWRFLEQLASRYYYSGGVKLPEGASQKLQKRYSTAPIHHDDGEEGPQPTAPLDFDSQGAALTVEVLARNGVTSLQAMEAISTTAFDQSPDLLILMYGGHDALQGVSLQAYRVALTAVAEACKKRGIDLIIAGPPLLLLDQERYGLGLTRPYSSVAREVAAAFGCLFVDAGSALARVKVDEDLPRSEQGASVILRKIRAYFPQGALRDGFHPNEQGHQAIADAAWRALLGTEPADPVTVRASLTLPAESQSEALLQLHFSATAPNSPDAQMPIAIGALGFDRKWIPRDTVTPAESTAGMSPADTSSNRLRAWKLAIPCAPFAVTTPLLYSRPDLPFGEEPFARGSLLVSQGAFTRLIDFQAPMLPLVVTFPVRRLEALEGNIPVPIEIIHSAAENLKGTLTYRWRGESKSLALDLPPGKASSISLALPLPTEFDRTAAKHELQITIKTEDFSQSFAREIEISPDLLLKQRVTLLQRSEHYADHTPAEVPPESRTFLTTLADDTGLYFILDLPPAEGTATPDAPAAMIEFTLDARGRNQRGKPGYVNRIVLELPWKDGLFEVKRPLPGLFGDGYDRELELRYLLASLTTQRDSRRQVRLSIPRNYLYLHEWNLVPQGQHTLGINLQVAFPEFAENQPRPLYPAQRVFVLSSAGFSRNDPQELSTLSLAGTTRKWTVRIY
jgi:lysophospholipase L1-like esterase